MSEKRCFKCKKVLLRSEFYRHSQMGDGLLGKCKECTKQDVRGNYAVNRERYREYEKSRAMLPHRVEARELYQSTPGGRWAMARAKERWAEQNPIKRVAHHTINNAVRDGRIQKPSNCSMCGKEARIHGHHDDYSKPLDVRWVCAGCHAKIHRHEDQRQST